MPQTQPQTTTRRGGRQSAQPPPVEPAIRPGYLTKDEAMRKTGRSIKRFEQLISRAGIKPVFVSRPNTRPMPTYAQTDIERLMLPQNAGTVATRPSAPKPAAADAVRQLAELLRGITTAPAQLNAPAAGPATPPVADKHLLTMKEAHLLGWPMDTLRMFKRMEVPPGVRYGKRGFKFSAEALRAFGRA